MSGSAWTTRALLVAGAVLLGLEFTAAQQSRGATPPVPFEDIGACPFEGCVYREWIAKAPVTVRTERQDGAPIAFRVRAGERVFAVTGVVVTRKPGRVEFREAASLDTGSGPIHVAPAESLYLLTYQGEGFSKVWFKGRVYTDVDVADFLGGACDRTPDRCRGRLIDQPTSEWWVRVRNRLGKEGWTRSTETFDGKDALARREPAFPNQAPPPLLESSRSDR